MPKRQVKTDCIFRMLENSKTMTKSKLICEVCGRSSEYYARNMCQKCYTKWYYSTQHELNQIICKVCGQKRTHHALNMCSECYAAARSPMKRQAESLKRRHKNGLLSMSENKKCSMYLGVHIAERILSNVFKEVKRMPTNHPGYDFICNHGKKIDVKSSCARIRKTHSPQWAFNINNNTEADYFLCIAFDNRESLIPLYLWMIPGDIVNTRRGISISETTLTKWNSFKLPLNKVISCCNAFRETP